MFFPSQSLNCTDIVGTDMYPPIMSAFIITCTCPTFVFAVCIHRKLKVDASLWLMCWTGLNGCNFSLKESSDSLTGAGLCV